MKGRSTEKRYPTVILIVLISLLVGGSGVVTPATTNATTGTLADGRTPFLGSGTVQTTTVPEQGGTTTIAIENFSAPAQIRPGENFTVTATVINNDPNLTVREVYYQIEGNVVKSKLVPISAGTTVTVTLNITEKDTSRFPHGKYVHGVFTHETHALSNLTVTSPAEVTTVNETTPPSETTTTVEPTTTTEDATSEESTPTTTVELDSFEVSEVGFPTSVQIGQTMSVSATVSNPNDQQATQAVTLRLDGTVIEREVLTLDSNEQIQVTFSVETNDLPSQDYFISVFTRDFGEVAILTVEAPREETTTT